VSKPEPDYWPAIQTLTDHVRERFFYYQMRKIDDPSGFFGRWETARYEIRSAIDAIRLLRKAQSGDRLCDDPGCP
jgi:hypothetical protein